MKSSKFTMYIISTVVEVLSLQFYRSIEIGSVSDVDLVKEVASTGKVS